MAKSAAKPEFPIGALAKESAANIETIRYYEKIGLMPKPERSRGGYRLYTTDHLKRLTFIRRGRELGFSLDELRHWSMWPVSAAKSLICGVSNA